MNQSRTTRRRFLKSTAKAGALLAAPAIIPAHVLGRNGAVPPSEKIQLGAIGAAPGLTTQQQADGVHGGFVLIDDPGLPGMLKGQFTVTISNFCEGQPATPVIANGVPSSFPEFQTRHFHLRSEAERSIGGLAGLTHAAVETDVSSFPFMEEQFVPVRLCY